jgi:hypothetical protein
MARTRRIVTGHDSRGRSIFVKDGPCPYVFRRAGGNALTELWWTDRIPASNRGNRDCGAPKFGLDLPRAGTICRIVDYPPDKVRKAAIDRAAARGEGQSRHYIKGSRHFGHHRTRTLDYAIVLEGEIYALMDEGARKMRAGDVLIQRGTAHAWSNRTDKNCKVAFILIDATPLKRPKPAARKRARRS